MVIVCITYSLLGRDGRRDDLLSHDLRGTVVVATPCAHGALHEDGGASLELRASDLAVRVDPSALQRNTEASEHLIDRLPDVQGQ